MSKQILDFNDLAIQREINAKCIRCGKSIWKWIYKDQRPIHIHLCEDCRIEHKNIITENIEKTWGHYEHNRRV